MFKWLAAKWTQYSPTSVTSELVGKANDVKDFSSTITLETPYHLACQEWDLRTGSAIVRAKNWRMLSFLLAAALILSSVTIFLQSGKAPIKPMLVEINSDTGQVKKVVELATMPFNPSESLKKHFMWNWIQKVRGLPHDLVLVNNQLGEVFYFVTEHARAKLLEMVNSNHPFLRFNEGETVSLDFVSMNQMSKNTFYFQWRETSYSQGKIKQQNMYGGTLTMEIKAPKDENVLMINPIGLWIDDFSFAKLEKF